MVRMSAAKVYSATYSRSLKAPSVNTRHGFVRTDHILFVAAGRLSRLQAFRSHSRNYRAGFPIRVELKNRQTEADFIRILKEPKSALVKQYMALLDTEGITLTFTDDASRQRSLKSAAQVNRKSAENIGARRLHTIMEKLLEEISFEGPDLKKKTVKIDALYVRKQLAEIVKDQDLSRYIL